MQRSKYLWQRMIAGTALALSILSCGDIDIDTRIRKLSQQPYRQEWNGTSISIQGLICSKEHLALHKIKKNKTDGGTISRDAFNSLLDADTMNNIIVMLRLGPLSSDKMYQHESDILMGFGRNQQQREKIVKSFNYNLQEMVWVQTENGKIAPSLCHMEQNFGLDNGRTVWVSFKLDDNLKQEMFRRETFTVHFDCHILGEGTAKLEWPMKVLKKVTTLG